jgi:hypothetical protein
MKTKLFIIIAMVTMARIAQAGCWEQKQDEVGKVKEQVVMALENTDPKEWKFGSNNNLEYIRVIKNNKEILMSISDRGTLSINYQTIDMSTILQKRVKKLYRKVSCVKIFKEVFLMKEFLGIL